MWKAPPRCYIFLKFFISLGATGKDLFFFVFIWQFLYQIIIYNLSIPLKYLYFQMSICRSLCDIFGFENMRFVAEVISFPIKSYSKIYFIGSLLQNFVISFFLLLLHTFPWMNKFFLQETIFSFAQYKRTAAVLRTVYFKVLLP